MDSPNDSGIREKLVGELVDFFLKEGIVVHSAAGVQGYKIPLPIRNDGYGKAMPRRPDVVGFDKERRRVVFGIVRVDRRSLDSEDSLEEYNVFLDHNAQMKEQASVLYVLLPAELIQEFTTLITHYIHREYWNRIIPVGSKYAAAGIDP